MAAFIINGTRFIYEEGKNNISFEVTNSSDKTYGGQVWIDNTDQGNNVYMIPQPPFFKIGEKQKQVIRIINTDSSLSKDKELLFWLNVQEVPPQPDAKDNVGNLLAIAMNTRVKLIYRPLSIKDDRRDAENKLLLVQDGNKTLLKNPTPYYFSIIGIKNNSKDVRLSSNVQENISRLAPFSSVSLDTKINRKVSIEAVNDWGGGGRHMTFIKGIIIILFVLVGYHAPVYADLSKTSALLTLSASYTPPYLRYKASLCLFTRSFTFRGN